MELKIGASQKKEEWASGARPSNEAKTNDVYVVATMILQLLASNCIFMQVSLLEVAEK